MAVETEINGVSETGSKSPPEKPPALLANGDPERSLLDLTRDCLESAAQYSRHIQHPDGHWCDEIRSNATITSEYVFFHQAFGLDLSESRKPLCQWLLSQQKDDGSWGLAPDYPGDVSVSVETYLALKILHIAPESPAMQRARAFILSVGGLAKVRMLTRIYLATFGLFSWKNIPEMPVELVFMPSWMPINIYKFASWARCTIMPILILCHHRPVYPLPNGTSATNSYLDELWLTPERSVPYSKSLYQLLRSDRIALSFALVDKVLIFLNGLRSSFFRAQARRMCLKWILEHQEVSGDLAGIWPAMYSGVYALSLEGYKIKDDCIQRALCAIEGFAWQDSGGKRIQACVSPVWDTALMSIGMSDCDLLKGSRDITKAIEWMQQKQLLGFGGDWRVYCSQSRAGGWSFEYFNSFYPDVDDTAAVILAFLKHDVNLAGSTCILDAVDWVLSMQNKDGGWAAFDIENDALFLNKIPFSDMDSLCDPSSADVTGRVIEALAPFTSIIVQRLNKFAPTESVTRAYTLADRATPSLSPGLAYLASTQERSTGAWFGRWGSNYIYGTSNVLCGLASLAQLVTLLPHLPSYHSDALPFYTDGYMQGLVDPAVAWLKSVQSPDGGFGEILQSYTNPEFAGCGSSTASQTAWGVMGLLAFMPAGDAAVEKGVRWLVRMQRTPDDGTNATRKLVGATWLETAYTGCGFPRFFFLGYDLYRHYFPMMALGRYYSHL